MVCREIIHRLRIDLFFAHHINPTGTMGPKTKLALNILQLTRAIEELQSQLAQLVAGSNI